MNDILFKPISENELIAKICSLLTNGEIKLQLMDEQNMSSKINHVKIINLLALENAQGDDRVFQLDLLETFKNSINKSKTEFFDIVDKKNYKSLGEIAHKLVPSCRYFDAHELVSILKSIENIVEQDNFDVVFVSDLITKFSVIVDEINKELEHIK